MLQKMISDQIDQLNRLKHPYKTAEHGGKKKDSKGAVIVSTVGLVLHSVSDGLALGSSLFCKISLIVCNIY